MNFTISQIFNRWIRDDRRIVLPKAIYENIVLPCHNMNFPFQDHRTFSRKFSENFPKIFKNFRKFLGKFLHSPPTPLTHHPYHSPTPTTRNCEPTQNFKFNFLNCTFLVHFHMYFPRPSDNIIYYILYIIQYSTYVHHIYCITSIFI